MASDELLASLIVVRIIFSAYRCLYPKAIRPSTDSLNIEVVAVVLSSVLGVYIPVVSSPWPCISADNFS